MPSVFILLLSMLHYSGVMLHAAIIRVIGSVSFAGDAATSLSLNSLYNLKQHTNRINPVHLVWHLFSFYIL